MTSHALPKPLVSNAADEGQLHNASIKQRLSRKQELQDLGFIMSDERGRRFMQRLIDQCQTFRSPYDPHGAQANFNMGAQNIGLWLYAELNEAGPDLALQMRRESLEETN